MLLKLCQNRPSLYVIINFGRSFFYEYDDDLKFGVLAGFLCGTIVIIILFRERFSLSLDECHTSIKSQ